MNAQEIIEKYLAFFKKRKHVQIPNASLVPLNDPTTLFTSSGMQPLVPYLLGEQHPSGTRLVDVQNCFRAVDIDEVGDNSHTTFFRMLGNWSLGDYFKKEQIPWMWELITKELKIPKEKLYVTVFEGNKDVPKDEEATAIWKGILEKEGMDPKERIFYYGVDKNWWSRSGTPEKMPAGEPGGPSSEMFYDFGKDLQFHEHSQFAKTKCHPNCDCGRFTEICNGVFMQYKKQEDGSLQLLPKPNVDFGGGLERLIMATQNRFDIFQTTLFSPIIQTIEKATQKVYNDDKKPMRVVADHLRASCMIIANTIVPSNKDQGYILRRLLRKSFDNWYLLQGEDISEVIKSIVATCKHTDPILEEKYEVIKNTILEEQQKYSQTLKQAKKFVQKKYPSARLTTRLGQVALGDELTGVVEISAEDAFTLYTTHGLSPTQIKSLGYIFDDQAFATLMEKHQSLSRKGAQQKFAGGLADHSEKTVMGHTATHLLHQALRDVLGDNVHQTGSNITSDRVRFDFNFERKLTDEELQKVEQIVNEKIQENLPVFWEIIPLEKARKLGAIGLFGEKYENMVKIYWIGPSAGSGQAPYSIEFCGGPHVDFTGKVKRFTIIKQENLGNNQKRLYAKVGL